mmetsp:Transcript_9691/g.19674  ORF Transcript_9691/g.19674 Transcript_9691/m.19674 type:complete len:668 (+) Transcript_9691:421-2424(+)
MDSDSSSDALTPASLPGGSKKSSFKEPKSRRDLPAGAVATLKAWLLSPAHFNHPYPSPTEQQQLMAKTGIDKKQLKNWFTNARRRIWKPMLKKQMDNGGGGPLPVPNMGGGGGGGGGGDYDHDDANNGAGNHSMQHGYGMQEGGYGQPPAPHGYPQNHYPGGFPPHQYPPYGYGGPPPGAPPPPYYSGYGAQGGYGGYPGPGGPGGAPGPGGYSYANPYGGSAGMHGQELQQPQQPQQQQQQPQMGGLGGGGGGPAGGGNDPGQQQGQEMIGGQQHQQKGSGMVKTDSHAVLMELFARDQELVRQAAERTAQETQEKGGSTAPLPPPSPPPNSNGGGQTPNSPGAGTTWPHFTSVSSLASIGGQIPGVKSITNLSAADSKASVLAHVKSGNSIGRADSYAFLEVFFDGGGGTKRTKSEEDAAAGNGSGNSQQQVGLSLDGDGDESNDKEGGSATTKKPSGEAAVQEPPLGSDKDKDKDDDKKEDKASKKRPFDDVDDDGAMAARGLLSVSRSSEDLKSISLPAKMQKSLSQEFNSKIFRSGQGQGYGSGYAGAGYGGPEFSAGTNLSVTDPGYSPDVKVGPDSHCGVCNRSDVDTQLKPCGHVFRGSCLKSSACFAKSPPECPVCNTPIVSALLVIAEQRVEGGSEGGTAGGFGMGVSGDDEGAPSF